MADAIEWTNASPDHILWRFPDNRIKWGSQLIVMENQAAIFYRDGQALDTFLAGRHKLTTSSMPSLVGWLQKKIKGDVFEATCIFISRSQFQGKYGGRGQTSDLAPLMFHGNFWFRVKEAKIFVKTTTCSTVRFDPSRTVCCVRLVPSAATEVLGDMTKTNQKKARPVNGPGKRKCLIYEW